MPKYKYDVITVGETTVDAFMTINDAKGQYRVDAEHHDFCIRPGEKINVDEYDFCMGGNATNVAVGLSRLGIKVGLCSEIGDDELSFKIRNTLVKEHLDRLLVKQVNGPSSFSVIINFQGDRTVFAQNVQRDHDFDLSDVTTPFVYLTSLGKEWTEPYKKALAFVEENNATLAFNPGSHQLREGREVLMDAVSKATYLFVNREEAERILFDKVTDKKDREYVNELMKKLVELGPRVVVVTDGRNGSYAVDEQGSLYWQGLNEGKVVERTGAGDSYSSGFLAAILYGLSVEQAMVWGSRNATSVVGKIGAEAGLLTKIEMEEATGFHKVPADIAEKEDDDLGIMPAPLA